MRYSADPFLNPMPAAKRAERVAIDTLEICLNKLALKAIPLPVPIEEWIEHPLGFDLGVEDLSHIADGVLGASYPDEGRIVVDQSVARHDGRFRFTVAHELGHLVLHKKHRRVFTDSKEPIRGRDANLERQADRFAAAILMPMHLVMRALIETCQTEGIQPESSITELMLDTEHSERLWRDIFVPAITRRFGVSRAAAINRFLDVRLREDRSSFLPRRIATSLRKTSYENRASRRPPESRQETLF